MLVRELSKVKWCLRRGLDQPAPELSLWGGSDNALINALDLSNLQSRQLQNRCHQIPTASFQAKD